jgi:hypothetical protein
MRRRMAELDRWYAAQLPPAPPEHRGSRPTLVAGMTFAIVVLVGVALPQRQDAVTGLSVASSTDGGPGTFAFLQHQTRNAAEPVTYNPCRTIEVVVNDALAPLEGTALLASALEETSAVSGLRFRVVGSTDELPGQDRPAPGEDRYGEGWPPVLVAWTTPDQYAELEGDVIGTGGSSRVTDRLTGRMTYVTGGVNLDAPALTRMLERRGGEALVRAVLMHELGHLVGLDHVRDPGELMSARNYGRTEFGPGDRAGLAILGKGACIDG